MTLGLNTKIIYPEQPRLIAQFDPPSLSELEDQISFKYVKLNRALIHCSPTIKHIVESVPLTGQYKHTLVDVKVKELKEGSYPCLSGYHLDCTMNPEHPTKPEIHHIYIYGCDCRTKFVTSPLTVSISNGLVIHANEAVKEQVPEIFEIEEGKLYSYNRFNLHSSSRAKKSGLRLLIRVTETDLVSPNPIKGSLL